MTERINKKALIDLVTARVDQDTDVAAEIVENTLEEIYQALKRGESVTLRNFGTLYVRPERSSWVFKFNPSQRLRKLSPPTKGSYERLTSINVPSDGVCYGSSDSCPIKLAKLSPGF